MTLSEDNVQVSILHAQPCHLGEGCTYDATSNTAWWFDILERNLFQADLGSGLISTHALPLMASVLAYVDDQRQLIATEDGLYLRSIATGQLSFY